MEIGWSLLRSVPIFGIPSGIRLPAAAPANVQPALGTLVLSVNPPEPGRFRNASNATVPSWQERHANETPVGCPGRASRLGLLYNVKVAPVRARFHNGADTPESAPCGVWQKTQISPVPAVSLIAPSPLVDRLCLVPAMPAAAALAADA